MDLNSLKSQFLSLQKSQSSFKLSERTLVDIINKIKSRGHIKFHHTISGKEYVVDNKINFEILSEVKKNKKISTIDLSQKLELPLNLIENKVNDLLKTNKNITYVDGKLMTNEYLQKITKDIIHIIELNGSASIAELSNRFELSIGFMNKFLKDQINLNNIKNTKLYPTRIITDYYIELETKKIRPALISCVTPINIKNIINKYNIDEMLIEDIINNLINKGELKGKFENDEFESYIYQIGQNEYIKGEFLNNNYIYYDNLKNIGINIDGREYLEGMNLEGVYLKDYLISNELKNNFESILIENKNKNSSTNLSNIFFFEVNKEDCNTLLESIELNPKDFIYINNNIIPIEIINDFIDSCKDELKDMASKEYNNYIESINTAKKEENKEKDKKKKRKNKKVENQEEIEINVELKKKELEPFINKLQKLNGIEDLNQNNNNIKMLFEKNIEKNLNKIYSNYIKEFIKNKDNIIYDKETIIKNINYTYIYLKILEKNFELLINYSNNENFKKNLKTIQTYFCKKDMNFLLRDLFIYQIIHMKLKINVNNKLNTYKERQDIIDIIPDEDLKEIFKNLNEFNNDKNFEKFIIYLSDNTKNLPLNFEIFDKKTEKIFCDDLFKLFKENLEKSFQKLEKGNYKDYIEFIVNCCNFVLCKKSIYFKLPNENWVVNIYTNLFNENKFDLIDFNKILNNINKNIENKDFKEIYDDKKNEYISQAKELYNLI